MTERSKTAARFSLVCMCIGALAFAGVLSLSATAQAAPPDNTTVLKLGSYGDALEHATMSTDATGPVKPNANFDGSGGSGSVDRGPGAFLSQPPNQVNGGFDDADCDIFGGALSRAENFQVFGSTTITDIRLWIGFFPDDHDPATDNMTVIFHNDAAGLPGTVINTQMNVPATRFLTGVMLFGVSEWEMTLDITDITLAAGTYHVEIFGNTVGDTDCMFWEFGDQDATFGLPDSSIDTTGAPGTTWSPAGGGTDLAFELIGSTAAVTGACCDSVTGTCVDDVASGDCTGDFTPNTLCADLTPPCGVCADFSFPAIPPGGSVTVNGNTCGSGNDCGIRPSEEQIWQVTIPNDGLWTFATCGSTFDTWLAVGTTCCDPGTEVGTNDDSCGLQSEVEAQLTAGTYFVTVEAFGSSQCGDYVLTVSEFTIPDVCGPFPNALDENEPNCGLPDTTNGGCNSTPPVFTPINCGDTYCSTAAADGNTRDTDWYLLDMGQPGVLTWEIQAQFDSLIFILIPLPDCGNIDLGPAGLFDAGDVGSISRAVPAGDIYLFAATSFFNGLPCDSGTNEYRVTLTADVVCVAGKCCNADGTCSSPVAEADCVAAGGTYQGNGTDCTDPPPPFVCAVDGTPNATLTVEVMTDNFPGETTWELVEQTSGVVASDGPFNSPATLFTQDVPICIESCYDFTIFDAFGDGICCLFGNGFYNLLLDGNLIATGGQFGSSETVANIGNCGGGAPAGCQPADADQMLTIDVLTDDFPGETTWELVELGVGVIASDGPFPTGSTHFITNLDICSASEYEWTIFDAFGDGICCGFGLGEYTLAIDGNVFAMGGEFGSEETVAFGGATNPPCSPELVDGLLTILVHTDDFPGETTWELVEVGVGLVASDGPFSQGDTDQITDVDVCSTSCYVWTIFDAFGDGICCGFGLGFYELTLNGVLIASGGEFADEESVQIGIPGLVCPLENPESGACCIGNTCVDTPPDCCAIAGGTFNGVGTFCGLPPTISCPADTTVECDGAGNTAELLAFLNSVTTSAGVCGDVSVSTAFNGMPGCGATGSTEVTFTVTDNTNGQTASCTATFTIADTVAPTVSCSATSTADPSAPDEGSLDEDSEDGNAQNGGRSGGGNADPDHGSPPGNLLLNFSAADVCSAPNVSAVITVGCPGIEFGCLMIPVIDGQIIDLHCSVPGDDSQDCKFENKEGTLKIKAGSAMLIVTAVDDCGNTSTCTVDLCAAIPPSGGGGGGQNMRAR